MSGLPKPYYEEPGIQIFLGNCRDILPLLPKVDLVVTSPPYNINNSDADLGHGRNWRDSKYIGSLLKNGYGASRDDLPWDLYESIQREILQMLWAALSESGAIYYNHKARVRGTELWNPLSLAPQLPVRQIITWARAGGVNFSITHYLPTSEWIILFAKPGFRLRDQAASGVGDVWYIPQEPRTEHPAPFPVELPYRAIQTAGGDGPILDSFMGSGTTLVAAKQLGRRAIGIEIEEKYCRIAVERLRQAVLPLEPAPEPEQLTLEGA